MPLLSAAAMSMILSEVGRLDDARRFFDLLMSNELDHLPPDYTALLIPVYASVACARVGDTRSAERLHAMLEPRSERLVTTVASWFGAVSHHLGVLAGILCRPEEAEARFADAQRTYASLDARPWLVRLRQDRAVTRLARRRGDDRTPAALGMERAAASTVSPGASSADRATADAFDRRGTVSVASALLPRASGLQQARWTLTA